MIHIKAQNTKMIDSINFPLDSRIWIELYLDEVIEKPEYPIQEEGYEDQEADVHMVFQRWEKRYSIKLRAIESTCDVLSLLPLMDYVYINDIRVYDVDAQITWEEEVECLANVVLTFSNRNAVKTL